jgi:hypothetical protein
MTTTVLEAGPLRDALDLVARRPLLPPGYMALLLNQDADELAVRLDAATRLGWLSEEPACCGRQSRYSVTEVGLSTLGSPGR